MTSGRGRRAFVLPPAGERGALVISERTRTRLAAEAAAEAIRHSAQVPVGARPRANVRLRRGSAQVRLSIALPYPSDIPALCADVRDSVAARCAELTGTPVRRVDVTVDRLERGGDEHGGESRTAPPEVRLERTDRPAEAEYAPNFPPSTTSSSQSGGER